MDEFEIQLKEAEAKVEELKRQRQEAEAKRKEEAEAARAAAAPPPLLTHTAEAAIGLFSAAATEGRKMQELDFVARNGAELRFKGVGGRRRRVGSQARTRDVQTLLSLPDLYAKLADAMRMTVKAHFGLRNGHPLLAKEAGMLLQLIRTANTSHEDGMMEWAYHELLPLIQKHETARRTEALKDLASNDARAA